MQLLIGLLLIYNIPSLLGLLLLGGMGYELKPINRQNGKVKDINWLALGVMTILSTLVWIVIGRFSAA